MRPVPAAALALLIGATALPLAAQMPKPGAMDATRVAAGSYIVEPNHSQVAWTIDHLGFTPFHGLFGNPSSGTLTIDPAKLSATKVSVEFPIAHVVTTSDKLNAHLLTPDFFDAAKYPTATFTSTSVAVRGTSARIAGTLTLHGVTKPLVLDAHFVGAGANPMSKKATIGFEATATLNRSDYGMSFLEPALGDKVDLVITAAFEKAG